MKNIIRIVVVAIIVIWAVAGYNRFVTRGEAINSQWAQVETQLQRRFDLIPNLEATVKGNAGQEQKIFGEIAEARAHYGGAVTVDQKAAAASQYEGAIGRLLLITENYPTLQSSQSFQALMASLEGTENRINVERMKYNDAVKSYNTARRSFPSNIIALLFGFKAHAYFEVPADAQANPQIDFGK